MSVWVNCCFVVQKLLVKFINVICSDINLSVVFIWDKVFELKKMNLYIVLMNHQVTVKVNVTQKLKP